MLVHLTIALALLRVVQPYVVPVKYTPFPGTSHFFSYGKDAGDEILIDQFTSDDLVKDDGVFRREISAHLPFLDLQNNTKIQLSVNGFVGFGEKLITDPSPLTTYPFYDAHSKLGAPQVDVFFTDLMFNANTKNHYKSCFSWQEHTYANYAQSGHVLQQANDELKQYFKRNFVATRAVIATWKYASQYGAEGDKSVTFQVALVTDEFDTYVFYHYATEKFEVEFFSPTAIGWQGKNPILYFEHPLSLFEEVGKVAMYKPLKMSTMSNVGTKGKWIYSAYKYVNLHIDTTPDPGVNKYQCPQDLIEESFFFCHYFPPGKYSVPYVSHNTEDYGKHYHIYYLECTGNDQTYCMTCAPTPNDSLYYSKKCDQCLYGPPKEPSEEVCYATPPPPTTTITTTLETNTCTPAKATEFCSRAPVRPSGVYANIADITTYYQCYNKVGYCMPCPPGTVFCVTDPSTFTGLCNFPIHYVNHYAK